MMVVLLYYLIIVRSDPMTAGLYSIITLTGLNFVRHGQEVVIEEKSIKNRLIVFIREFLEGSRRGCEIIVDLTIMIVALGIVIRAFVVTGLAQSLSRTLIEFSGGDPVLLVLLAGVVSIIFGLGMPTLAAYLLVALFVAPSLESVLNVNILAIHFFVLYFALVSNITPPIAIGVVIAQGISGAGFIETATEALRMGFPMYILPFIFIAHPAILEPSLYIILLFSILLTSFVLISLALVGPRKISIFLRLGLATIGLGTIFITGIYYQIILSVVSLSLILYIVPNKLSTNILERHMP